MAEVSNHEQDPVREPFDDGAGTTPAAGPTAPDDAVERDRFAHRTEAAEALPLTERADAFSALYDELRTRLESGGSTSA